MKVGIEAPWSGPEATVANLVASAAAAERLGFDRIWMGHHWFYPTDARRVSPHPYSVATEETVVKPLQMDPTYPNVEFFTGFAYLAAHTSSLRFHANVFVLPSLSPLHTAKLVSSLDYLSGGRFTFGVGSGWMREEFEDLGTDWDRRGRVTDEYIEALRAIWGGRTASFHGEFVDFGEIHMEPKPVQDPLPIHIVGSNRPSLRRVARLGDGWLVSPTISGDLDKLEECRDLLATYLEDNGRTIEGFPITTHTSIAFSGDGGFSHRRGLPSDALLDDPETVGKALEDWAALGVTGVDVNPGSRYEIPLSELLERMEWIAEHVVKPASNC